MTVLTKLNIGIVGACGRGASFKLACDALANVRIHAVCDINAEELPAAVSTSERQSITCSMKTC